MGRVLTAAFSAALLAGAGCVHMAAQTTAQAQASGSASESTSVSAGKSGAQAQSQTGAQATTQGALSSQSGSTSAQAANSSRAASGSTVHATLVKPVDARKNKAGDEVIAKNTQDIQSNGQVIVPKGCKLVGHVTEVKAKGNGEAQSAVGIAFDHAILKDGREVPMTASIQALAAAQQSAAMAEGDDMMAEQSAGSVASTGGAIAGRGTATGGGLVGGATHAVGTTGGSLVNTAGASTGGARHTAGTGASATGALSSTSRGVVGLNGLQLNSATSSWTQGSVITSSQRNVHLDSGTQMILLVSGK
jgi:hypothetical protein